MKERLQKLLAQANIASRRASEDLIIRGRVRVNGVIAHLGDQADPDTDVIEVDGTRLNFASRERIFIALNKPKHVLTTDKPHRTDQRQTVMDFIDRKEHLFSIGRLDADSEGLVVMTNDGDTAQRLSHPRYRHSKSYRVEVYGLPTAETLDKWRDGIFLEEGKAAPCFVEIVKGSVKGTTLRIVMTEGKKRQIRRVAAALGHPVQRLLRTHIGMYPLGDLAPGATRVLTAKDILALSTPAPEIKQLRAQPRRSRREEAPAVEETTPEPSRLRVKPAAVQEDARRERRTRSGDSEAETPRRTARGGTGNSAPETKRRAPRPARLDESGEKPRPRPTPRTESSDTTAEKPRPRRTSRIESSDTTAEKPRARRVTRTESADEEQRPKRTRKVYPPRKNKTDVHRQRKQSNRKKTRK